MGSLQVVILDPPLFPLVAASTRAADEARSVEAEIAGLDRKVRSDVACLLLMFASCVPSGHQLLDLSARIAKDGEEAKFFEQLQHDPAETVGSVEAMAIRAKMVCMLPDFLHDLFPFGLIPLPLFTATPCRCTKPAQCHARVVFCRTISCKGGGALELVQ